MGEQLSTGSRSRHCLFLLLAGCWLSTSFLAPNISLGHSVLPVFLVGLLISSIVILIYLLISALVADKLRSRLFAALVGATVAFNTYGVIFDFAITHLGFNYYAAGLAALAGWVGLFLVVVISLWILADTPRRETAICIGVAVLFGASIVELGVRGAPYLDGGPGGGGASGPATSTAVVETDPAKVRNRPDIYYFILDAYGRADQLRKHVGLDVSDFLNDLKGMGFVVPADARSNYMTTNLSLGHTLLGDYFVVDQETYNAFLAGHGPSSAAEEGWSPVVSQLESLGYNFVRVGVCTGRERRCLNPSTSVPIEVIEMLHNTPLMIVLRYAWPGFTKLLDRRAQIPKTLQDLADLSGPPVFALVHFMYPHDTTLNEDCSPRADAVEHTMAARTARDRLSGVVGSYRGTVKCINGQLLTDLRKILARPGEKIIVLAGDHGSSFSVPANTEAVDWPEEAMIERASIFNAWWLPAACRSSIYDGITPVNHFRLILACVRGEAPKFLRDLTYAVFYGDARIGLVPPAVFADHDAQ